MRNDVAHYMGVPVHRRTLVEALEEIDAYVDIGRATGRSHQVVTVNTNFLVTARRNDDVRAILCEADLAVADGMPIVWASKILGQDLPARVAGSDLGPALAARAARDGRRLMMFGGSPGVAVRAAEVLRSAHPALTVATTTADVGDDAETDPAVLEEIRAFDADIVLVALGHPKQERWIRRYAADLGVPVAIGVGGTFDYIARTRRRAPRWTQRIGAEWLYRTLQEPRRLGPRYLLDLAIFVPHITMQIVKTRGRATPDPAPDSSGDHTGVG